MKMVKIIPITITLLLLLIFASILIQGVSETAYAPFLSVGSNGLDDGNFVAPSGTPEASDSPHTGSPSAVAEPSENVPVPAVDNGFITIRMASSDISRGSLILINSENRYEIPDEIDLIEISERKTPSYRVADGVLLMAGSVIEPLNEMLDAYFDETGSNSVTVTSAFRDFTKQQEILDSYIAQVGLTEGKKWAAPPGHSEHHAGLALDFGVFSNGSLGSFLGTNAYSWFFQYANQYGFIQRYPDHKTHITKVAYEPWHFRYVGTPHAHFIRENNMCLEEYIDFLKDFTRDKPYSATFNDEMYEVYFTPDSEILIPFDCEFDISGNNIDGFLVTIKLHA